MIYRTCLPVLCLIIITQATVNAQPDSVWARIFDIGGWDECADMIATSDGGYALVGHTLDGEELQEQLFLLTTDSQGNRTHHMSFGDEYMDMGATLIQQNNGSFLVGGWSHLSNETEQDVRLIRVDPQLQESWTRTYGGHSQDRCYSMIQNSDGNIVMAGCTSSFGTGLSDFWLVCSNESGDSLWSRAYGDSELQECYSVIEVSAGGYCLAGYTGSNSNDDDDFLLVRTTGNGEILWQSSFGGDEKEKCFSLIECVDDGYLLAGETSSFGEGGKDGWIVRVSASGDSLWSRSFGGAEDECFNSICPLSDGGFVLGGRTESFTDSESDLWLVRIDQMGNEIWNQTFGGRSENSWDECMKVIQTTDGSFVLAGITGYPPGEWQDTDFIMLKTSPDPMSTHPRNVGIVKEITLSAFPNPFNTMTSIRFTIPVTQVASLTIYNLQGRIVHTLFNGTITPGTHEITFEGSSLSTGTYFLSFNGEEHTTEQLILLK